MTYLLLCISHWFKLLYGQKVSDYSVISVVWISNTTGERATSFLVF